MSGVQSELYSVFFLDINIGWIVGWSGIILKTTDGGMNWVRQVSNPPGENFRSVIFVDQNNGWIVGDNGKILKTTNGGNVWTNKQQQTSNDLQAVYFANSNEGWICGFNGTILKSIDGGENWTIKVTNTDNDFRSLFSLINLQGGLWDTVPLLKPRTVVKVGSYCN
jgi:photosystem II stability/assembly factor-like uncharacterized protein